MLWQALISNEPDPKVKAEKNRKSARFPGRFFMIQEIIWDCNKRNAYND